MFFKKKDKKKIENQFVMKKQALIIHLYMYKIHVY